MSRKTKIALQFIGIVIVIIGIIGLFLPFLQGLLLIIIGVAILSVTSPSFKAKIDKILEPHPKTKAHFTKHHDRLHKLFNRP